MFCFYPYSCGYVYCDDSGSEFRFVNAARNVRGASTGFSQYNDCSWYGQVCPKNLNTTCAVKDITDLVSGTYVIQFSALKHFGNQSNPDDYDNYRTPPFELP